MLALSQVKYFGSRSDDGDSGIPREARDGPPALPITGNLEESRAWRDLPMNANPVLWLQAYIIGVLVFLLSITAITEHPKWFN